MKAVTTFASNLPKSQAWVAYLDVYGFKALVATSEVTDLSERLLRSHIALFSGTSYSSSPAKAFLLSDSIFLVYPVDEEGSKPASLQACIEDIREILDKFIENDLPLRGAVAFGEICHKENVLLGEAVVRAVTYENILGLPIVVIPARELQGVPVPYLTEVPTKEDGRMLAKVIMPTDGTSYQHYVAEKAAQLLVTGPFSVAATWARTTNLIEQLRQVKAGAAVDKASSKVNPVKVSGGSDGCT